jgi:hypothetical protein
MNLTNNNFNRDVLAKNLDVLKNTVNASRLEYSAVRTANVMNVKILMDPWIEGFS